MLDFNKKVKSEKCRFESFQRNSFGSKFYIFEAELWTNVLYLVSTEKDPFVYTVYVLLLKRPFCEVII